MSSAFTSTDGSISLDELNNVTGFDRAQPGVPYSLVKKTAGGVFEPEASASAVSVDPNGGLEITGGGDLKIKVDATSGDPGLNSNADGLSVINRVKTAGDTMTGDLEMMGNLVKGLPVDFPPAIAGDAAVSWAQVIAFDAEQSTLKVSKSGDMMTGPLNMGGEALENLPEPSLLDFPNDAATVGYVDSETKLTGILEQSDTLVIAPAGPKTVSISGFTAYFATIPGRINFAAGSFVLPDSAFIVEQINTFVCTDAGNYFLSQNVIPDPKDQSLCRLAVIVTVPPDVVQIFAISPHMSLTPWDQRVEVVQSGMNLFMDDHVLQTTTRVAGSQKSESVNYPNQPNNFIDFAAQDPASLLHWNNNVIQPPTTDFLPNGPEHYVAGVLTPVAANSWTIMYHVIGTFSDANFIAYTEVEESSVDPLDFLDWQSFVAPNDPTLLQVDTLRTIISVKGNFTSETDRIVFTAVGGGQSGTTTIATTKPIITIIAERNGDLTAGFNEWSFGAGLLISNAGYVMPRSGRVLALSLYVDGPPITSAATVTLLRNALTVVGAVTVASGSRTGLADIIPPHELTIGDPLHFATSTTNANAVGGVVSALIELDI